MDFRGQKYKRGIRNNNPGNIEKSPEVWQGKVSLDKNTDSRFEQFVSVEYGLRALMKNAITWVNRGENTIEKLISKWAPPSENNTAGYIKQVSADLGISSKEVLTLDRQQLIALAKAIAKKENAPDHKHIPESSYQQAYAMIGNYQVNQIKKK